MLEDGHWYTRDGAPFYTVRSAKGDERAVTLRDARKIGAVPSVTTVLQVIAKPQLARWQREQVALAALTLPRMDGETSSTLLARIDADASAQVKAAAEEGTRIHDAIEQSFKGGRVPDAYLPHVEATRAKIAELFPDVTDWVAETSFAHGIGFGGKVDLHSPSTGIVIDYKGKDGDFTDGKKLAYDQHWQLGAYSMGLVLPLNEGCNIFVSRTHPGCVTHHIWSKSDMQAGEIIFTNALALWKHLRQYDASFPQDKAA